MINDIIVPLNKASCNFILNVAPNREGLIDANAVQALTEIGELWQNKGSVTNIAETGEPIISPNLAKGQPTNSSWSDDMNKMDFANDDSFKTSWVSSVTVKSPWLQVDFKTSQTFNTIVLTENESNINKYRLEYYQNGTWKVLANGDISKKVKVHRFNKVSGDKVRITIEKAHSPVAIAEVGVYNETR